MPAAKAKTKACKCFGLVNEKLKEHNTALVRVLLMTFYNRRADISDPAASIATKKIDTRIRKPAKSVIATYCPFCGKKYA